jgi:DNA polymerase theta
MTTEERSILEDGYNMGYLRVLAATQTLSSGVNMPARRVIMKGKPYRSKQEYHQMKGRAGRSGKDTHGESILIVNNMKEAKYAQTKMRF